MVDFLLAISHQLYMAQTKVRPIVTPKKLSEDCQEFFENIIRGCDLYLCHWNFVLTCNPRLRGVEMLTHKFVHMVQVSSERPLHGKNEFTVPLYYNFLSAVEMHKKISQTSIGHVHCLQREVIAAPRPPSSTQEPATSALSDVLWPDTLQQDTLC